MFAEMQIIDIILCNQKCNATGWYVKSRLGKCLLLPRYSVHYKNKNYVLFFQSLKVQTQNAITNAQNYLQGHLQAGSYDGEDGSSYTLAIVTKALVCSSSTSQTVKNMAINKLESKAINNGNYL